MYDWDLQLEAAKRPGSGTINNGLIEIMLPAQNMTHMVMEAE